jgi:phenylacetate-CoA ligase
METQWWTRDRLQDAQSSQLRQLIEFAYLHVPYYKRVFDAHGLRPTDIDEVSDMAKLPVLNKKIIRQFRSELSPQDSGETRVVAGSTGGSTGDTLRYAMSPADHTRGVALLYRGWGYAGYQPGDRIGMIGGSSLIPTKASAVRTWMLSAVRNARYCSSYGMTDETMSRYVAALNRFRPEFLRGYASALWTIANHIRSLNLAVTFRPRGIFTTAEKLLAAQRYTIEEVFRTKVFDTYGLNDGGVSAYECDQHSGMHVDMERSILEVVGEDGQQIFGRPGRILATSLYNRAFPFIRYDTGDLGTLALDDCRCGRESPLLQEIIGRSTDLLDLNGRKVGSPVLTVLLGKCDVEQYQIIQDGPSSIVLKIVKGKAYTSADEEFIRKSLLQHVGSVKITFEYAPAIVTDEGHKHKFIRRIG